MSTVDKGEVALSASHTIAGTRTKSRFRSAIWLIVAFGILTLVASGLGLATVIPKIVTGFAVQRALYHKGPVDLESAVVRPLIDTEQTFDLAVTVWVATDEYDDSMFDEEEEAEQSAHPLGRLDLLPPGIPLYSDIVFRGLRLQDKNVFASVNFTLPTAYFRNPTLHSNDLRGSIVLIPNSPSPLDRIVDYSTWIPDFITRWPVRSWPFPLNSTNIGEKTLMDKALESFGVSVPLLRFHNIRKRCHDPDGEFYLEDDNEELSITTEFRSPLTHHPYIVTRTQIRIVDETSPFNRRAYLEKHRKLRLISCEQDKILFPSIYDCERSYNDVGHVETAMTLMGADEGRVRDMVYSPYISLSKFSGPKDLLAIPVHRQFCSTTEDTVQAAADDQEYVDVSWNLAFSGRSFPKFAVLESMDKFNELAKIDMELSEHRRILMHDEIEMTNGVWGYNYHENAHPRRRYLLSILEVVLATLTEILNIFYWWTRTSTVGISTAGTLLLTGSSIITTVAPDVGAALVQHEHLSEWLTTFFSIALWLLPSFLMLRTVFHLRGRRPAGSKWTAWIPQRNSVTHAERASERLENRMSNWIKAGIILTIFAIYYAFSPHSYAVIPAILPDALPDDYYHTWLLDGWPYLAFPMDVAGVFFQLWLSWQSKSFAGSYRIASILKLTLHLLRFAEYIPGVVGPYDARGRLVAHELVELGLISVATLQSMIYPRVEQEAKSFHTD